jgi:hypothetical protein
VLKSHKGDITLVFDFVGEPSGVNVWGLYLIALHGDSFVICFQTSSFACKILNGACWSIFSVLRFCC